jgi:hypothetical protein
MPKITVNKESLEGLPSLPAGTYDVRLDGFKPRKSKKGDSVNLNAIFKVINNPTYNDREIWLNCNTSFPPAMYDMAHGMGVPFEAEDTADPQFPGEFQGPDDDPSKWNYIGPLIGRTGQIEVADKDNGKGGTNSGVKRFFCQVAGCTGRHKDSLL